MLVSGRPDQRQRSYQADGYRFEVQLDACVELVVRDTAVELVKGTGQLEAGQVGSKAVVDAGGEADVGIGMAVKVDSQGVGERPGVCVRPDGCPPQGRGRMSGSSNRWSHRHLLRKSGRAAGGHPGVGPARPSFCQR